MKVTERTRESRRSRSVSRERNLDSYVSKSCKHSRKSRSDSRDKSTKNIMKDQIQVEDTLMKHQELKHQDHIVGLEKKILHTEGQEVEKGNQEDITVVILQMLQHQYPNQDHL